MNSMAEFAKQLAAEAERRGMRIIIEPTNAAAVEPKTEPVQVPRAVPEKEIARENHSWLLVSEAARMLSASLTAIYARIYSGEVRAKKSKKGYWMVSTDILDTFPRTKDRNRVRVQSLPDGTVYESVRKAAQANGVSPSTVSQAIKNGYRCKGMTFVKA